MIFIHSDPRAKRGESVEVVVVRVGVVLVMLEVAAGLVAAWTQRLAVAEPEPPPPPHHPVVGKQSIITLTQHDHRLLQRKHTDA